MIDEKALARAKYLESQTAVCRTVGDVWKALTEGKTPAVEVSSMTFTPPHGPNVLEEALLVERIQEAGETQWQANCWLLQHRYGWQRPNEVKVDHTGAIQHGIDPQALEDFQRQEESKPRLLAEAFQQLLDLGVTLDQLAAPQPITIEALPVESIQPNRGDKVFPVANGNGHHFDERPSVN
jgi:hypothetical protein